MEVVRKRVCVTGAGGFVASWLVKLLLSKGHYTVHGTVRDTSDAKNAHLKVLDGATENLQLFKADVLDYASVAMAVAGCEGVFHIGSPVPATKSPNPEVDLIAPALTGTLNVLKACHEAKISQVVVVSSLGAVGMNPNWPKDKVLDEDCWSDEAYCRTTENWYFLAKTLAEHAAFDYAEKTGLNLVTVCPSLIIGPLLQSKVNTSSLILMNCLRADHGTVKNKLGSFIDVRDVADALLLVYEHPMASGRYICSSYSIKLSHMTNIVNSLYPTYNSPKNFVEVESNIAYSSKKLQMLGWKISPLEQY